MEKKKKQLVGTEGKQMARSAQMDEEEKLGVVKESYDVTCKIR